MPDGPDDLGDLRRRILALKDEAITLVPQVSAVDQDAAASVHRARLALFEAWTILAGPPEEDQDD